MRLRVLAIVFAFTTTSAYAGGVDWSDYVEKPGESRPLVKTTPEPTRAAEPAPTAKPAKAKRVARSAKAKKAGKAKAKSRTKAKRRR